MFVKSVMKTFQKFNVKVGQCPFSFTIQILDTSHLKQHELNKMEVFICRNQKEAEHYRQNIK